MSRLNPTVRYLIVCEDIQVDPQHPRRVTIVGLISAIRSIEQPAYPLLYQELCVFVQLTGCRNAAEARIEINHADSGETLFKTLTRTVPFGNDPLEVVGVVFRIRNCQFLLPGLYWIQFWCNEQMLSQQPLILR
ncbi:MAG: DUF6941 family protein [Fimbriiglobus sp.]